MSSATENFDKYSNNTDTEMIQDTMNTILHKVEKCSGGTLTHFIFQFNLTRILILEFVTQFFF